MELIHIVTNYFNDVLRKFKDYPETYTVTYYRNKYVLTPNQPSKLLQTIKIDTSFKISLISSLLPVFRDKFIFDDVYLSSHATDIVINLVNHKLIDLDTGIFAIIFSYLNQDEFTKIKELPIFN